MATKDLPTVSIITPSYNQVRFLGGTIRSVLAQEYPHIEHIVIDGGSTDGSDKIIAQYADQLASWTSEPDRGQSDAINKGFKRSKGEVVAWLNSDDLYMPYAVAEAVEALEANPEAGMVYANGILIDEENRLLDWHRYRQLSVLELLSFEVILQPTVFMRREVLKKTGYLNDRYNLVFDHDLWVRIAATAPIIHIPRFWAAERTYPEAKTVAAAAEFADEARLLIEWAATSENLSSIVQKDQRRINASLESFIGRRMIDAGRYQDSLSAFRRSFNHKPSVLLKYWYKVLQAGIGAVGLEKMFQWYRRSRRGLQHGDMKIKVGEAGQEPKDDDRYITEDPSS